MLAKHEPKGLYFEDYEIGKEYVTQNRTVTESDVARFASLSGDFNPLHTDDEFGKTTIFGTRIAHGALGLIISQGLLHLMNFGDGTVVRTSDMTVKYPAPLRIGATVRAILIPDEKLPGPEDGTGIVKQTVLLVNQDDAVVMESHQTVIVRTRA
ncbi:MAG: MaoC family dehydratase N-terminal domain-containing protein [Firmicutes bacterium]|nr:MaoC family dehydratase N-terminal domain-containing protein [Bacillota bacterium]MBQ2311549.1 MaoC family dehydratase N-terminal domain-containing protein [Bacillota bacterium]MBQ3930862.1 MaoC family dehydratase N-terminal domain-containing protein [Bacillota bacterium]MBR3301678.1 MaoC family dehydratase N-terminal domain-containing protein [Bacillota bacterium]MBR6236170.1 MaoC family dehydratase N-terminal domain-containing protein [Bacillota bacterium]